MNKLKKMKQKLGNKYSYEKYMSDEEIYRLQNLKPKDFTDMTATSLIAGCVRIDAVIFKTYDGIALGYDVFVKDSPDSSEWICYDNLTETVSMNELDMFYVLDKTVESCGLSYTECNFESIKGKKCL